ncbi:hypothetical protein QYE76_020341 [Lolium multiflorum]|uniref:Uncharacterized protein n=1 Tax=Lolium multiflorum TaxID=4521 RepID=A0AAD8VPX8_LOLMU|nr:hypothetical protein QYE76_020341 [Lolium multiflorum]
MAPARVLRQRPRGRQQPASRAGAGAVRHGAAVDAQTREDLRHRNGGADVLGRRRPNAVGGRAPPPRLAPEPRSGSGAAHPELRPRRVAEIRSRAQLPADLQQDPAYGDASLNWDLWFEVEHDARRRTCFTSATARLRAQPMSLPNRRYLGGGILTRGRRSRGHKAECTRDGGSAFLMAVWIRILYGPHGSGLLCRSVRIRLQVPGLDFILLDQQQLGRPMGPMPPSPSVGHPGLPDLGHVVDIPINSLHWRRKTYAPYFASPSAATRRRRFRKTKRRKRSRHPARRLPTYEASPRQSFEAGASGEASAKKPKIVKPPPLDSRKAERERLKMLSTAGKHSRPIIPGAPTPTTAATRTASQKPITEFMKKSPAVGPATPPSTSHTAPPPSPPQADQSPPPAANTPPEIIPVSSEKVGGEDPKAKSPAQEETQDQGEAEVTSSEKVGTGAGDVVVFPKNFGDPSDLTSTPKAYATKFFNKLTETEKWDLEQDLLNAMLNNAWGKPDATTSEIQDFKKGVGEFFDKLVCKQKEQQALDYELHKNIALQRRVTLGQAENIRALKDKNAELNKQLADAQGASSSLATTSSELESLRSSYQELEKKLKEAEQQKERAEKQLAEKNSELIREKGEFVLKRNADSETIKRQQKDLNGLRKYMETAEHHWDLLAENILEPLGYPEKRRNKFPRDDVLSLAGDDCKDLISASRKICHNLSLKRSRTSLRKLIKRMDILPELVTDLQASSARGAATMTLTMCLAHNPKMDLDRVTSGVPPTADVGALLDAVSGYDTRIARRIRHEEFYDKVVLPAEARPAESGTQFTWTSSKDAPEEEPKTSAATSDENEESDEDVSSPAEAPKEKIQRSMLLRPRRSENVYVLRDKTMHHFGPSEGL